MRAAITLNSNLKRIFLNDTELTTEGAIALAEVSARFARGEYDRGTDFGTAGQLLPDTTSLIHLDLTDNFIDIAGVLALSVAVRMNQTLRCLDLNIPVSRPARGPSL